MEWDQEICIELINEYRNKEILWNPRDSAYYNKVKKEYAWKELSEKIGKSSEEVKRKIESLKGSYRREKARVKTSITTGKGRHGIYKSKWFAYESLQFLDDKDDSRRILSNLQTVSDDEVTDNETWDKNLSEKTELERSQINEKSIKSQTLSTEQLTAETQNKEFKSPKKHPTKQRKTDQEDEDSKIAEGYMRQTTAASQQRRDQCSLFGDYIAEKLRTFDNRLRAIAQNKISNILFELEINLYQNPGTHTSVQSPFPVYSKFDQHTTQTQLYPYKQTGTRNPTFYDQFSRLPISAHHSTFSSDSFHFHQKIRSTTPQDSDNQPSTSSTPVTYISSSYPSPQENKPLSKCFQQFSSTDSSNDSQHT